MRTNFLLSKFELVALPSLRLVSRELVVFFAAKKCDQKSCAKNCRFNIIVNSFPNIFLVFEQRKTKQ